MGVYINIEMPIDGNETIIRIQPDGTVLDQYGHHLAITAVPVPPHGRLIDADALAISTAVPLDGKPYQYVHIDNIKNAPTIIPAEEGET